MVDQLLNVIEKHKLWKEQIIIIIIIIWFENWKAILV